MNQEFNFSKREIFSLFLSHAFISNDSYLKQMALSCDGDAEKTIEACVGSGIITADALLAELGKKK